MTLMQPTDLISHRTLCRFVIASALPVLASLGRGAESRGAIPGGGTAALTAERIAELRSPAPPVRPDHPYLPLAKKWADEFWPVVRAIVQQPAGELKLIDHRRHAFWTLWSVLAPEGPYQADATRRKEAFAVMDRWTEQFVKWPREHWDILGALEVVNWVAVTKREPAAVQRWLVRLRAAVEANLKLNQEHKEWPSWTPNPLIQSTAILALAAQLYSAAEPADPAPALWRAMARECLNRALTMRLPGGAFGYILDSGPDPGYFNFDSTFLGRYWQLTGDATALTTLQGMAEYARSATLCGKLDAVASPWWKHNWVLDGPHHGPEVVATLSRDPLTKYIATKRLAEPYSDFWTYYPMLFWDPNVSSRPVSDRCEFDRNANGPALRAGPFDVVMPGCAWNDATFGVSLASRERVAFDAYLTAARLMLHAPGPSASASDYGRHFMTYTDDVPRHAAVVGAGWIAAGWRFTPRRSSNALRENARSGPADRIDLWFADAQGAGGLVMLEVNKAAPATAPAGWLRLSAAAQSTSNPRIVQVGPLHFEVGGDFTPAESVSDGGKAGEPGPSLLRLAPANSAAHSWPPGTRFHYTLSTWPQAGQGWRISEPRVAGTLVEVTVSRDAGARVVLVYNRGDDPADYVPRADAAEGRLSGAEGRATTVAVRSGRPVSLPACALLVIHANERPI